MNMRDTYVICQLNHSSLTADFFSATRESLPYQSIPLGIVHKDIKATQAASHVLKATLWAKMQAESLTVVQ